MRVLWHKNNNFAQETNKKAQYFLVCKEIVLPLHPQKGHSMAG